MARKAIRPCEITVGIIATAPLLLAACHVQAQNYTEKCGPVEPKAGWNGLDKCVLESQVQSQVAKQLGRSAPLVSCPDELDADLGASTVCTFTDEKGTFNVTVTVTSIDWGNMILDDGTPGNFVSGNAQLDVEVAGKSNP